MCIRGLHLGPNCINKCRVCCWSWRISLRLLQLVLQGAFTKVEVLHSRVDWKVKIAGAECLEDCGEFVGICGHN